MSRGPARPEAGIAMAAAAAVHTGEHYLSLAYGEHHLKLALQLQLVAQAHQCCQLAINVYQRSASHPAANLAAIQLANGGLLTQNTHSARALPHYGPPNPCLCCAVRHCTAARSFWCSGTGCHQQHCAQVQCQPLPCHQRHLQRASSLLPVQELPAGSQWHPLIVRQCASVLCVHSPQLCAR